MLGLGLLPLGIATLVWASALRRRSPSVAVPASRVTTAIAFAIACTGVYLLVRAHGAAVDAAADLRGTVLAEHIDRAMKLTVVAYAVQVAALATVALAWWRGGSSRER